MRVLLLSGAALLTLYAAGWLAAGSVLRRVEREQAAESIDRARSLLARTAEELRRTTVEFGFWTDTWDYVARPFGPAAEAFLRANFIDWIPRQYAVTVMAIWTPHRRPLFAWTDSASRGTLELVADSGLFRLLDREKSAAGLVPTARGLFMIGAAVVVRSEDVDAIGPRNGYLLFGMPVTDSLERIMSRELRERVRLAGAGPGAGAGGAGRRIPARGDSAETTFWALDVHGRPSVLVTLTTSRAFVDGLHRWTLAILTAVGVAIAAGLGVLTLAGRRVLVDLLDRPLGAIAAALEGMQRQGRLDLIPVPQAREWSLVASRFNQTVAAQRASERMYRTLFEQAADALFVLDPVTRVILDANPAALAMAGCQREQLVGTLIDERLDPVPTVPVLAGPYRFRDGGEARPVSVASTELMLEGRSLALVAVRDLTEHEQLQEQLRQAQKMEAIGSLAGGIAHDFNNLLTTIVATAELIRSETPAGSAHVEDLESIRYAGERGVELTRKLLAFARPQELELRPVALGDLVHGFARLVRRMLRADIELRVDAAAVGTLVRADPGAVEQMLMNLMTNARDAMPDGGRLRLAVGRSTLDQDTRVAGGLAAPGEYVFLAVSDSGMGMDENTRKRIFEPFFTMKPPGVGTGLGLAIVYALAKQHRGHVHVHSELRHGTTFTVYFPAAVDAAAAVLDARLRPLRGGTETILLVDDDESLRRTAKRVLQKHGYTVLVARDGREALAVYESRKRDIALVVSDVVMPELGGLELVAELRRRGENPRILLTSGYTEREAGGRGPEPITAPFLAKPWSITDLLRQVREVLDQQPEA